MKKVFLGLCLCSIVALGFMYRENKVAQLQISEKPAELQALHSNFSAIYHGK